MATQYPSSLKAVGGARTGIAPVNLLDVLDVNGNLYYWSDRSINAPVVLTGAIAPPHVTPPILVETGSYIAWVTGPYVNIGCSGSFVDPGYCTQTVTGLPAPTLPPGAVISGIYQAEWLSFESTDAGWDIALYEAPDTSFSGQLSGPTMGTDPAVIPSSSFTYFGAAGGHTDHSQISIQAQPAIAVYYTLPTGLPGAPDNPGVAAYGAGPYVPWILQVPEFRFNRSLVTDTGAFVLQNLSGDTLSRDFEKIMRRSALEGAMFVYRSWQADAQAAWIEVHGTLTVDPVGVDTVTLKCGPLMNPSQLDTPAEIACGSCQLQWGGPRCGSTQSTECQYSYQSCQVPERIMAAFNNYEKNYGVNDANTALNVINRRRTI